MISYGDMLDTIEKNEPQKSPTVVEKKGDDNASEKKDGNNVPEKKDVEPENEVDEPEDVI